MDTCVGRWEENYALDVSIRSFHATKGEEPEQTRWVLPQVSALLLEEARSGKHKGPLVVCSFPCGSVLCVLL